MFKGFIPFLHAQRMHEGCPAIYWELANVTIAWHVTVMVYGVCFHFLRHTK